MRRRSALPACPRLRQTSSPNDILQEFFSDSFFRLSLQLSLFSRPPYFLALWRLLRARPAPSAQAPTHPQANSPQRHFRNPPAGPSAPRPPTPTSPPRVGRSPGRPHPQQVSFPAYVKMGREAGCVRSAGARRSTPPRERQLGGTGGEERRRLFSVGAASGKLCPSPSREGALRGKGAKEPWRASTLLCLGQAGWFNGTDEETG